MDSKGNCSVSVFTSLEKPDYSYNFKHLYYTKQGDIYPLPKSDTNFPRWTGLSNKVLIVPLSRIQSGGLKMIKRKHHFMIDKQVK